MSVTVKSRYFKYIKTLNVTLKFTSEGFCYVSDVSKVEARTFSMKAEKDKTKGAI